MAERPAVNGVVVGSSPTSPVLAFSVIQFYLFIFITITKLFVIVHILLGLFIDLLMIY